MYKLHHKTENKCEFMANDSLQDEGNVHTYDTVSRQFEAVEVEEDRRTLCVT